MVGDMRYVQEKVTYTTKEEGMVGKHGQESNCLCGWVFISVMLVE